ncbi:acyl-CoA dehydrogenase [Actinophytocola oryzae]|uniref:Alkylation response protein AidB-like acyl-CoA dehydrogenase n=1 Tax=Actinophytocola oryzae TaxID=502181 RepID=A0A4R7VR15_9PSEU|nr:acyl-CoA dehydrogenase [Actinophytocola oryzae]TDV51895.1 alkylation response protein AidB-like acyl-CoA dehydrogenase [Actinophytocola oryzae]
MPVLLSTTAPKPLPLPRSTRTVAEEVRRLADGGELTLPLPGVDTGRRWTALAALGRTDLAVARLAEGHVDALAILAEAGRPSVPDALYGVWAARSGGTGAELTPNGLEGTVRFCSGLTALDRALVVATTPGGDGSTCRLVDVDLRAPGIVREPEHWQAIGMDASDSGDVRFDALEVTPDMVVGPPGWYLSRPGFVLGGGGVAAVWLGGTAGVVDDVLASLASKADEHQLAHLGAVHTALRCAEALLADAATRVDTAPETDHTLLMSTCRAAAERAAWETLDRVPRITGATPLCRDHAFAQRLADLQVYVRQHHAERDLAALGRAVLTEAAPR